MTGAQPAGGQGRTAWARNLAAPVRDFLNTETGGAVVLLCATIAALVWANSPWSDSYDSFWTTKLSVQVGNGGIAIDLRHWVNQGLMTFFFLVVGLEAKRELDLGELRERRRLAVPVVAAIGGMVFPVAIYLAFNAGGSAAHGWGVAMSTDTAFALGVLALLVPRATRVRLFLLTLAVVDDLVALAVIATVYAGEIDLVALATAVGLFAVLVVLRYAPLEWRRPAALIAGVALWVALYESGVDPIVGGLLAGLVISAYPPPREELERATALAREFREQPTAELARSAQLGVLSAVSPNERLQHRLHPWTSFVIVPLFALANAGIHVTGGLLDDALGSTITLGILAGYVVGKPLGILAGSWLATRPRAGGLRLPVSMPALSIGGAVAGIGFTVSLLIASLAFQGRDLAEAKVGILAAALLAAIVTLALRSFYGRLPATLRARQIAGTADEILDLARDVDSERDHVRGPADAPVTLVEYADFECPYCGRAEPALRELLIEFGDDLRYVFRHLPLSDVHPHAEMAAEAAETAAAQGRFWEMHDQLFERQDALTPKDFLAYAGGLGLDVDRFADELRRHVHAPRVADDVAGADESGVGGTPTFFINGRRHQGPYDVRALGDAVQRARARARLAA